MRSTRVRPFGVAFPALVALAAAPALAGGGATFYAIGDLPGGTFFSRAYAVSADGTTVVGNSVSSTGLEAFRWSVGGGLVGIGDLAGGSVSADAEAVSADGSVIVGSSLSGNGTEAFRWTASTGMVALGDLPGGPFFSDARAVSADGSAIAGRARSTASGGNFEAFRWTSGGGMVGLGDLSGSSFSSTANGISGDGQIVVGLGSGTLGAEAFRWTSGSGLLGIGDLSGGVFSSVATAISADGGVIVGWGNSTTGTEAFRRDGSGNLIGLGILPAGGFASTAYSVNADGSLIGGEAAHVSLGARAFLWDAANGLRDLKDLLVGSYGLALGNWKLERVTGISADGSVLCGWGTNPSNQTDSWVVVFDTGCAPGADTAYGTGKPGSTGTPLLDAPSPPVIGVDSPVRVSNALPGALSYLAIGVAPAALPFDGGTLLVAPIVVLPVPVPIAGDGTLVLHGVIPADPGLCGLEVFLQALVADPGAAGAYHLALTNGLKRKLGT